MDGYYVRMIHANRLKLFTEEDLRENRRQVIERNRKDIVKAQKVWQARLEQIEMFRFVRPMILIPANRYAFVGTYWPMYPSYYPMV